MKEKYLLLGINLTLFLTFLWLILSFRSFLNAQTSKNIVLAKQLSENMLIITIPKTDEFFKQCEYNINKAVYLKIYQK